jgi:hypothetical protein
MSFDDIVNQWSDLSKENFEGDLVNRPFFSVVWKMTSLYNNSGVPN